MDAPKTRREQRREATYAEIKAIARQQMTELGTGSLSLRAIANQMRMTAPAIYRYFENRDALITELLVDAFSSLAQALEQTAHAHAHDHPYHQLLAILHAYRAWAVNNPTDFQLTYGNPIPHYVAPRERTVPAVIRGFAVIVGAIQALIHTPQYTPKAPYDTIPAPMSVCIRRMIDEDGYPVEPMALYLGLSGWTQLHGIISLELYHHLQPVVGDVDAFYQTQMVNMLASFGATPPSP